MASYRKRVENIMDLGQVATGADFLMEVEDFENLSMLAVTCNPELPGPHPIETAPGQLGIEMNLPGHPKTGGMFPITFQDSVGGVAIKEYKEWIANCRKPDGKKKVRIWMTDGEDDTKSELDVTYLYCWPEAEAPDFDSENKTAPLKITCNLHFALRMWTSEYEANKG